MGRERRTRLTSYAFAIAVVVAVAVPGHWSYGDDSFPLSNYPMFSKPRRGVVSVSTVVGIAADGTPTTLTPELIGGARWINMAARLVRETVPRGRAACEELCAAVAQRVADSKHGLPSLEVVTETFDSVAYSLGESTPMKRRVHARCSVER
ncbi:MAG: hypothetical protein AAF721_19930 [Myxococcota bacterium]